MTIVSFFLYKSGTDKMVSTAALFSHYNGISFTGSLDQCMYDLIYTIA